MGGVGGFYDNAWFCLFEDNDYGGQEKSVDVSPEPAMGDDVEGRALVVHDAGKCLVVMFLDLGVVVIDIPALDI